MGGLQQHSILLSAQDNVVIGADYSIVTGTDIDSVVDVHYISVDLPKG